jgi:phosphomannomutase
LDAFNGAGSRVIVPLLERLGCTIIKLNCTESGKFPVGITDITTNPLELIRKVGEVNSDIGFAVDSDAVRLSVVLDNGNVLNQELILTLIAHGIMHNKESEITSNLQFNNTTRNTPKGISNRNIKFKSDVSDLILDMKSKNYYVGGDRQGRIIIPNIQFNFDAIAAIGFILDCLSKSTKPVSTLIQQY